MKLHDHSFNELRPIGQMASCILVNSSPLSAAYMRQWTGVSIGSDNGLSPIRHQAIIYTSAWLLLSGPLRTNFSEILIEILNFSYRLRNGDHFAQGEMS